MTSLPMTEIAPNLPTKSDSAFRTISEVAEDLGVQQHVLRFWETKFSQVKPMKRGGGRRYYRPEDVALLKKIHTLLYAEGYTIKGVQKLLKGVSKVQVLAEQQASKAFGDNMPKVEGPTAKVSVSENITDSSDDHVLVLKSVLEELLEMRSQVQEILANKEDKAA
jgi:DNA-binding transcriptional MerR regulator